MRLFRPPVLLLLLAVAAPLRAQSTLPAVLKTPPAVVFPAGSAAATFDLTAYLGLPGVTGSVVQFDTSLGKFNVELFGPDAPRTVANFLGYVNTGAYDSSIFHYGQPGVFLSGGGFKRDLQTSSIPAGAPIANEFKRSNVRGTIAMSKPSDTDPNSATTGWFFNLADNSGPPISLDTVLGGNTVFGRVLGSGLTIVDTLSAVPVYQTQVWRQIPLLNFGPTQTNIQIENYLTVNSIKPLPIYPAANTAAAVLSFTLTNSNSSVASATLNGSTLTLQPIAASGSTTITVRATDTNGNTASAVFTVTVAADAPPVILTQPASLVMSAGTSAAFFASAAAQPAATYQWRKNGTALAGATEATLLLRGISAADAASYTCVVTNSLGAATTNAATLSLAATGAAPGRLANLSVRGPVGTQPLIVGFTLGGAGTTGVKPLLIRGVGPALTGFGVTGVLANPTFNLLSTLGATVVATNDDWAGDTAIVNAAAAVGAFALPFASSRDAALYSTSVASGGYTVLLSGVGGTTGVALAEIYDATPAAAFATTTPRLINLSARNSVGAGGEILIAGFNIAGDTPRTVLIRAVGPTLSGLGVSDPLADPKLEVYSGPAKIFENNDWGGGSVLAGASAATGAFALPTTSRDAILLLTLAPGSYTAQVSAATAGATGSALVEVYELP